VIVFADVRQRWHPDALGLLVENFADPQVGAATGELCLESSDGAVAGVGFYWRYEKWIRKLESRAHSMVGVTGAISAVRRELFCEIPARTLLDDVYWPMQVAMRGYRVVHDERARAYDRLPDRPGDEFSRKVRTLSGNFQLIARLPMALLPTRNPVWFQFVSHKLMRLAVPWLLLAMLLTAALLTGSIYRLALAAQIAGYALALAGFCRPVHGRSRLATAATSFLVLNAAAWWAFWIWLGGRTGAAWKKVRYEARPLAQFDAETRSSTA
jgi:cellulose synthase/poly-beta-1,6-N-acetylglucosamine synthase-like glycosyltransferase